MSPDLTMSASEVSSQKKLSRLSSLFISVSQLITCEKLRVSNGFEEVSTCVREQDLATGVHWSTIVVFDLSKGSGEPTSNYTTLWLQ